MPLTPSHATTPPSTGPLAGFVVLDLTRVLSGPYCTMLLGDLGATVIKVEQPGTGDDARGFLPFMGGESALFASFNRGKKSIALDLKRPEDRIVLEALMARADVLVENFRPGVLDKLGYGWDAVHARWPALVMASISGFGQTGPYCEKGAYDPVVVAMGGLMSLTGHAGMPPVRPGTSLGDLAAGLFAANGIQAGLLQRSRNGQGSHVDISMLDCQVALLENAIARTQVDGKAPVPIGSRHPGSAPYDAFAAADGHVVVTAGADNLFKAFMRVIGRPELADDPRYRDRPSRVAHEAELKRSIEESLAAHGVDHWLQRCDEAGVPAGPVNDISAMMRDPQIIARGTIAEIEGSAPLKAAVTPLLFSDHGYPARLPPAPRLDEHRDEILAWLQAG